MGIEGKKRDKSERGEEGWVQKSCGVKTFLLEFAKILILACGDSNSVRKERPRRPCKLFRIH